MTPLERASIRDAYAAMMQAIYGVDSDVYDAMHVRDQIEKGLIALERGFPAIVGDTDHE